MSFSLVQLFEMMGGKEEATVPFSSGADGDLGELFGGDVKEDWRRHFEEADLAVVAALHSDFPIDFSVLPPNARRLYKLSGGEPLLTKVRSAAGCGDAFCGIVRAWMSELPVCREIVRFGQKLLAAPGRRAAYLASVDLGDPDVQVVEAAAYKVLREFDRLLGLLRFTPGEGGAYIALCEPDHFVLPAFGPHFRERFGPTPWAIIDERRRLCLSCGQGQMPVLFDISERISGGASGDQWEALWRHYHKTINNESRSNPDLQKQFMPMRYWKYLPEL